MNPLTLPLSLAGLWFYFGTQDGKPYRVLGWAFVVLLILFTLVGAKSYFLSPAYPTLFAGGAVLSGRVGGRAWGTLRTAYLALLLASGLLLAPLAMPVLPPAVFARTYGSLSAAGNASAGQENQGVFPQYLGDRFGWNSMTRTVADAYDELPARERSEACVFTSNYGEASALNFLGQKYDLPPAISGHKSYYLWGPDGCDGKTMITVGVGRDDLRASYSKVALAGTTRCLYCEPDENGVPVYVARKPRAPLRALWPETKHFD